MDEQELQAKMDNTHIVKISFSCGHEKEIETILPRRTDPDGVIGRNIIARVRESKSKVACMNCLILQAREKTNVKNNIP